MKIYSWNVNGIRAVARKDAFLPFIKQHNPDIICLQETKAQKGQTPIDLPEYHEYWSSAEKPGYSGTAIFTKIKPVSVTRGFPSEFEDKYSFIDQATRNSAKEGRVITAEFKDFYLITVYTPNTKRDLSRLQLRSEHWDPAFLAYCKQLEQIKPVIFCGDLNVAHTDLDLARPKENVGKAGFTNEERQSFDNFIKAGFIDTFRIFNKNNGHYTWWTHWANARANNVGWRIDYFLVSQALKNKVKEANIHPEVTGSDHCPISINIDV
ncbi:MAG: exodeoxyribonuclease III [Candidatus Woesebacteria bacterium]|jgi:exodeoxyribonuclease-3